ncbi:MAG: grasp-with-spasm system SPASM domain peptide maturase [Bacteroidetes bacterium 43-16]|nr:MAG: grasp-with-spasm system SPASM domain peptide maturase [Bacteroidetes bacterium 43-16]
MINSIFDSNIPLVLFQNCQLVKGQNRGTICDLQFGNLYIVPNSMIDFLLKYNKKSIMEILKEIGEENKQNLKEYLDFLISERLIFFSQHSQLFPQLNLNWESPLMITNAIIELTEESSDVINNSISHLDILGCTNLEIRIFSEAETLKLIQSISGILEGSTITSVSFLIKDSPELAISSLVNLCDQYGRITSVDILNSNKSEVFYSHKIHTTITYHTTMLSSQCCGKICQQFFSATLDIFTESQHHNTCLNRKIAIDAEGNIKNCPSMKESFGNIKDTSLAAAINKPGFKKYWNIKKDEITKCKDCEFRHVCTDCRAYLDDPEDMYSAPLKCGYDPYTCEWDDWSTNPLKTKAIMHYGLNT